MKGVFNQKEWSIVSEELEKENLKLTYYDNILIPLLGNIGNKHVLDYGPGPGVLAITLQKLGADVKTFDISEEMNRLCGEKIGHGNVYNKITEIHNNNFDFIICNLVLCINPENEVKRIVNKIRDSLKKTGFTYIGFCNPKVFDVPESKLDIREQTGHKYEENHDYNKIKKEGNYKIVETHRPIEWYEKIYQEAGLKLIETIFTPEYEFKGRKIKDFVIFKLSPESL